MIIGMGLPRTGTRTLYEALKILNLSGSHYCDLTGKTGEKSKFDDFTVDNSIYNVDNYNFIEENVYILTYRDSKEWKNSIKNWNYVGPDIDEHKNNFLKKMEKLNFKFLIYNVSDGWKPLCEFLDKKIPNNKFPHVS